MAEKKAQETLWYNLTGEEALKALGSTPLGLTDAEAQARLAQYGPNELVEKEKVSPLLMLLEQFKSFLIIILLGAVVLSAILGEITDAIVIFGIVIACAVLGFVQEYRSEKAVAALKKLAAPLASVLRGGEEKEVPARELVPGDVVILTVGNRVPADGHLLEAINLRVEEAVLTGESLPVDKITQAIPGKDIPIGDRRNSVYMGTAIAYGRGKTLVTNTGMKTEFGKIAVMLQEVEVAQTPLQRNLNVVGKWLGIGCLGVAAVVAGLGVFRGHPILEMLIWGVSLAVAAVPEALPAIVTMSLAIGVQRMVKRHALVRKLPSVETLGSTTVICSDKTGTLTQDQMTVRQVWVGGRLLDVSGVGYEPKGEFSLNGQIVNAKEDKGLQTLMLINTLCNDTHLLSADGVWHIKGDPTEGALVVVGAKAGIWHEEVATKFPRVDEVPFSSERKRMTTIHTTPQGKVAYSKGAPEVILESCTHLYGDGREREMGPKEREIILEQAQHMAGNALRVLGMAYKPLPQKLVNKEDAEKGMVFMGLAGMIDPPREEVKEAIRKCDKAGIKSVMITGDHKLTAVAIAKELGLLKEGGLAVTGPELDKMSDQDFEVLVEKIQVYARVSPAHKLRVVEALSKRGHIVAMTGDGVNDAPALKKANIGVAMGITGTDVTREAADMVLTDDNFASIVAAVEEGRGIFDNIKKFLLFLLSCNVGEVLLMFVAGLMALPLPLVAIHLLWVNLVTDGLPALALGVDPHDPDVMGRKPRDPKKTVFDRYMLSVIGGVGIFFALAALAMFDLKLGAGTGTEIELEEAQTMVLATVSLFELFVVFAYRSERHSIFKIGLFSNPWLVVAVAGSTALLLAAIYIPFVNGPFHTVPLPWQDWLVVIPVSLSGFVLVEIIKAVRRFREKKLAPATA